MKIRKLCRSDLQTRVEWMNSPETYSTMNFVPPISIERTLDWYEDIKNNPKRFDAAFISDNDGLVAFGGLTNIDFELRKAEFYVFVHPGMHRRGYGTDATYLLCRYGFDVLHLHKVYLFTNAGNIGARRMYEKVGFRLEGVHREEKIVSGQYEDRLYYGLLNNEIEKDRLCLKFIGGGV